MRFLNVASGALLLLGASACAHVQPEEVLDTRPHASSQASSHAPPQLIGCSGYVPPLRAWTEENRVWIEMKVRPDGSVEPGSPRHQPSRFERGDRSAVDRAMTLARACSFHPAQADEGPVEAWTVVQFAFT